MSYLLNLGPSQGGSITLESPSGSFTQVASAWIFVLPWEGINIPKETDPWSCMVDFQIDAKT